MRPPAIHRPLARRAHGHDFARARPRAGAAIVAVTLAILGARAAAADPATHRVFTAPTAWLPAENVVIGSGSVDLRAVADTRAETGLVLGYGLGNLAAVELGTDTDVRGCTRCADDRPEALYLGRAAFRLGARQDALFRGMPAVVVGVRATFARRASDGGATPFHGARVTEGYLVASRELGPVRLHAGLAVIDAGFFADADRTTEVTLGPKARPSFGVEWEPPKYPKTSVMADLAYVPRFETAGADASVEVEWVGGWGVRYQAFPWGAIELGVRHREDEGLGDSTVLMRFGGVFGATQPNKSTTPKR